MAESQNKPPLILVVDDDESLRELAAGALEAGGFRVIQALDGLQAVNVFKARRPDLVMLDVMMPRLNGFEACLQIRASKAGAHTPILIATTLDDLDSINRAYQAGATDFAIKPLNYATLPHRVRYMLRAKATADALRDHRARLARAQRIAKLGYWHWNLNNHKLFWSDSALAMLGLDSGDSPPESFASFLEWVHPNDRDRVKTAIFQSLRNLTGFRAEHRMVLPNGQMRNMYQEGEFDRDEDGAPRRMAVAIQDITDRKLAERKIISLAHYDNATGLPNRQLFLRFLHRAMAEAESRGACVGVLALDLSQFKRINDSLGHQVANELLRETARRIASCLRRKEVGEIEREARTFGPSRRADQLARIDGDELMALLPDITCPEDCVQVAQRIAKSMERPLQAGSQDVYIKAAVGISSFPDDGRQADQLIHRASSAAHHALKAGRGQFQFFSATLNEIAASRLAMEANMRKAVEDGDFLLYYQPKVDAFSGRPLGVEALLRWRRPQELLRPGSFIELAEETGLIGPIGRFALHEACRQAKEWQDRGLPPLAISVNLSPTQFHEPDLMQMVAGILEKTGLAAQCLELEITESAIMRDPEANAQLLAALKKMGLKVAIDDFGTGYSSLSYLKRLPIDSLKIDKSFIDGLGRDSGDEAIVSATIDLAHKLLLRVVAEGVEREDQLRILKKLGCEEIQGYFFSKPLPPAQLAQWLATTAAKPRVDAANSTAIHEQSLHESPME